jgi:hypothetical protein
MAETVEDLWRQVVELPNPLPRNPNRLSLDRRQLRAAPPNEFFALEAQRGLPGVIRERDMAPTLTRAPRVREFTPRGAGLSDPAAARRASSASEFLQANPYAPMPGWVAPANELRREQQAGVWSAQEPQRYLNTVSIADVLAHGPDMSPAPPSEDQSYAYNPATGALLAPRQPADAPPKRKLWRR